MINLEEIECPTLNMDAMKRGLDSSPHLKVQVEYSPKGITKVYCPNINDRRKCRLKGECNYIPIIRKPRTKK